MKPAALLVSSILLAHSAQALCDNKVAIRAAIRANTNDTPRATPQPAPRVQPAAPRVQPAAPHQGAARNDVVTHVAGQVFASGKPAPATPHRKHDNAPCANPALCFPVAPAIESVRTPAADARESDLWNSCLNESDDIRRRDACALIASPGAQRDVEPPRNLDDGVASTEDAKLLENISGGPVSQEATEPPPQ